MAALLWLWSWFVRNFMRFSFWDSAPCSVWKKNGENWKKMTAALLWLWSWFVRNFTRFSFWDSAPCSSWNFFKKTEKNWQQLYYDCGVDMWEISWDALFEMGCSFLHETLFLTWHSLFETLLPALLPKKKIDSSTTMTLWKCFVRIFIKCSFRDSSSRCAWKKKRQLYYDCII